MKFDKMNPDMAAVWLQMALLGVNPGIEAEDDWGIELPVDGASHDAPDAETLMLRTVSF